MDRKRQHNSGDPAELKFTAANLGKRVVEVENNRRRWLVSKGSDLMGVGAVEILCRQSGPSFDSTEMSSRTSSSLPLLLFHSALLLSGTFA